MKKKISILTIIICIILISGCINKNETDKKNIDAETKDLKFTITLDKYEFNNINNTTIYAEIKNINNNSVTVIETFSFYSNIYGKLKTPSNLTYLIGTKTDTHPMKSKIKLNHGEKLKTTIQMNDLIYYIENKQGYNWSEIGSYNVQFWYISVEPYLYSNIVNFNITN